MPYPSTISVRSAPYGVNMIDSTMIEWKMDGMRVAKQTHDTILGSNAMDAIGRSSDK